MSGERQHGIARVACRPGTGPQRPAEHRRGAAVARQPAGGRSGICPRGPAPPRALRLSGSDLLQGKTCEWVAGVVRQLAEAGQDCLATRVNAEQADHLAVQFPQGEQDRLARTFWLPAAARRPTGGTVVVITAGTSDLPVAQEAVVTARALGSERQPACRRRRGRHPSPAAPSDAVRRRRRHRGGGRHGRRPAERRRRPGGLPGRGGADQHRLRRRLPGVAPLLTMLNSCSANVVVVNIDSGFKGGYVAALIARRRQATE